VASIPRGADDLMALECRREKETVECGLEEPSEPDAKVTATLVRSFCMYRAAVTADAANTSSGARFAVRGRLQLSSGAWTRPCADLSSDSRINARSTSAGAISSDDDLHAVTAS